MPGFLKHPAVITLAVVAAAIKLGYVAPGANCPATLQPTPK